MADIYLPTLHWFENDNSFSGSDGPLRFMLTPHVEMATAKEVDAAKSSIHARLWHGPYCLEKSRVEAEADFPMAQESIAAIRQWLSEHR